MAKIERYNGNVAAFASQSDTNKRTTFGTTDTGDDTLDGNLTEDYLTGWQIVGPNDSPTLEDFNAAMFTAGQFLSYLHQAGVPEWNGVQQYQIGSYVNRAGVLYVCKTADHVSVTAPESDGVNWDSLSDSLNLGTAAIADVTTSATDTATGRVLRVDDGVNKGSAQTVTGVKTFTGSPIIPTATAGFQAATYDQTVGQMLGVGQAWQSLSGSRSFSVTYTNTTGRPISVIFIADSNATYVINVGIAYSYVQANSNIPNYLIIPDGVSYNIDHTGGGLIRHWLELR